MVSDRATVGSKCIYSHRLLLFGYYVCVDEDVGADGGNYVGDE